MLPIDLVIAMAFIGKVPKSQRASGRLGWVVRLPLSLKKACEPSIKLGATPIVVSFPFAGDLPVASATA